MPLIKPEIVALAMSFWRPGLMDTKSLFDPPGSLMLVLLKYTVGQKAV